MSDTPHTPHTLTTPPGPPPGLGNEDEPHDLPPVAGLEHEEDPWQDLAPVRTAFAPNRDGFYVLHDVEPAFLALPFDLNASSLTSLCMLADCVVRWTYVCCWLS